jgi:nucleotide-binding universal stress UspA family protein
MELRYHTCGHCIRVLPIANHWGMQPTFFDGIGERLLAQAAQYLADLAPQCDVLEGPAADAIVRVVALWHADLIVLGSGGRHVVQRVRGSVSRRVLEHAPCAVVVAAQAPTTPALHDRAYAA